MAPIQPRRQKFGNFRQNQTSGPTPPGQNTVSSPYRNSLANKQTPGQKLIAAIEKQTTLIVKTQKDTTRALINSIRAGIRGVVNPNVSTQQTVKTVRRGATSQFIVNNYHAPGRQQQQNKPTNQPPAGDPRRLHPLHQAEDARIRRRQELEEQRRRRFSDNIAKKIGTSVGSSVRSATHSVYGDLSKVLDLSPLHDTMRTLSGIAGLTTKTAKASWALATAPQKIARGAHLATRNIGDRRRRRKIDRIVGNNYNPYAGGQGGPGGTNGGYGPRSVRTFFGSNALSGLRQREAAETNQQELTKIAENTATLVSMFKKGDAWVRIKNADDIGTGKKSLISKIGDILGSGFGGLRGLLGPLAKNAFKLTGLGFVVKKLGGLPRLISKMAGGVARLGGVVAGLPKGFATAFEGLTTRFSSAIGDALKASKDVAASVVKKGGRLGAAAVESAGKQAARAAAGSKSLTQRAGEFAQWTWDGAKRGASAVGRGISNGASSAYNSRAGQFVRKYAYKGYQVTKEYTVDAVVGAYEASKGFIDKLMARAAVLFEQAGKLGIRLKNLTEAGASIVAKLVPKVGAGFKTVGRLIPGFNMLLAIGLAASRLIDGDFAGAGLEILAGLAVYIPVVGVAISLALSGYLIVRDIQRETDQSIAQDKSSQVGASKSAPLGTAGKGGHLPSSGARARPSTKGGRVAPGGQQPFDSGRFGPTAPNFDSGRFGGPVVTESNSGFQRMSMADGRAQQLSQLSSHLRTQQNGNSYSDLLYHIKTLTEAVAQSAVQKNIPNNQPSYVRGDPSDSVTRTYSLGV